MLRAAHFVSATAVAGLALTAAGCRPPPPRPLDAGEVDAGEDAPVDAGPPFFGDDLAATVDLGSESTLHCTVLGLATSYAPATNVLEVACAQSGAAVSLRFPVAVATLTTPGPNARIDATDALGVTTSSLAANLDAASFSIDVVIAVSPPAGRAAGTFSGMWDDDGTNPAGSASGSFDVEFDTP